MAQNLAAMKILRELELEVYASYIVRQEFTREDFAAFRRHCRSQQLSFCTFSVLTPLPGTDLSDRNSVPKMRKIV